MLKALEKEIGHVSKAAKLIGINRRTHNRWYQNDAEYRLKVDDILDAKVDDAEVGLYYFAQQIDKYPALALRAILYILNTKGKARGWGENQVAIQVNTQVNNQQGPIWDLKRFLDKAAEGEDETTKKC